MTKIGERPVGTFCLVLHTHLPWVAHAGTWPVGEEWLHQAFTGSWRRVLGAARRAGRGRRAGTCSPSASPRCSPRMLDDPYCLRELHTWAGTWQLRADELAGRPEPHLRRLAGVRVAAPPPRCLADLEARWLTGGLSAVLRPLVDGGVVELLGGPATHPFQPLLDPRVAAARAGGRPGRRAAPARHAARPGSGRRSAATRPGWSGCTPPPGSERFVVDGPGAARRHRGGPPGRRLRRALRRPRPGGDLPGLVAEGRATRARRTTATSTPSTTRPASGRPGSPAGTCRRRPSGRGSRTWPRPRCAGTRRTSSPRCGAGCGTWRDRHGRPGLVVACFDTELFGHWWHEGPDWLAAVLRALPAAGVRVTTLRGAVEAGHVGPAGRAGPVVLGHRQGLAGVDRPGGAGPGRWRRRACSTRLLSTVDANRGAARDPVAGPAGAGGVPRAVQRLGLHGHARTARRRTRGTGRPRTPARVHALADLLDAGRPGRRGRAGGPAAGPRRALRPPGRAARSSASASPGAGAAGR